MSANNLINNTKQYIAGIHQFITVGTGSTSVPIADIISQPDVNVMTIQNGNVGIGTVNPKSTLHVVGNILSTGTLTASNVSVIGDFVTLNTITSNTEQIVITNAGTGPALKVTQTGDNSVAEFYDNESGIALFVGNNGNVGVGTTVPRQLLDVQGNAIIGGNVGVGTTNPQAKLHVGGTSGSDGVQFPDGTLQVSSARGTLALIQSGSSNNALTIPLLNLNGDIDKKYVLELQGTVTTAADRYIYLTPNNATGDTYWAYQFRLAVGPTATNEQFTTKQLMIGRTVYQVPGTVSIISTLFAESGYDRSAISSCKFYASTTKNGFAEIQSTWQNTSTNITSLTVNFDGGTFTGRWRLYAPR